MKESDSVSSEISVPKTTNVHDNDQNGFLNPSLFALEFNSLVTVLSEKCRRKKIRFIKVLGIFVTINLLTSHTTPRC